ncbi:hypothetical protein ABZ714_16260 [Streptomyces sp. NPDC006798]|uniref:hypothetical protein n=1 Tax=Streptomyces sp. NPDC006798 TaxID=3155462 RepID=UPI0033F7BBBF
MYTLSIDTESQSYAAGQVIGVLLVTAAVMGAIWYATRSWRRGPVPVGVDGADGAERAGAVARRRRNIICGVLLIVAVGGLIRVLGIEKGEPASADAGAGIPERVIEAAPRVGAYRLLTGEEAALYEEAAPKMSGKLWFYDGPGEEPMEAALHINTAEWDKGLAAEKRSRTMANEMLNFFAGAKATGVTAFDAGPWGGRLSCGYVVNDGARGVICAWTDRGTLGSVVLPEGKSLADAAELTLRFRTATEKRA